jgi:CubicO group peptidase (beta-lactamase class C family)
MSVLDRLTPLLQQSLDRHGLPGASLAVFADNRLYEVAAGVVNTLTGAPSTPDSLFMYGSATKTVTATMALRLIDEGRLSLDDLVSARVPEFQPVDKALADIRIRDLLTHSSGLVGSIFVDTGCNADAIAKQIPLINAQPRYHAPGALLAYCNSGYVLLGRAIELATELSWEQAVQAVAAPLNATIVTRPEQALRFNTAIGHVIDPTTRRWVPIPAPFAMAGHAPAGSTMAGRARDLVLLARGYLDGSLLRADTVNGAWRVHAPALAPGELLGWGLGWSVYDLDGRRIIGHDGSTAGTKAYLRVAPEQRVIVALLVNAQAGLPVYEDVVGEIFRELIGAWEKTADAMPTAPLSDIKDCVGAYSEGGVRMEISIDDGQAKVTLRPNASNPIHRTALMTYPVHPCGPNAFYTTGAAAVLYPPAGDLGVKLARVSRLVSTEDGEFLCSGPIICRRLTD